MDDALWEAAQEEASRRNISASELVRIAIRREASTPRCFHCGAPAVAYRKVPTTKRNDLTDDELIQRLISPSNGRIEDEYTPVSIRAYACDPHLVGLNAFLMDTYGAASGRRLVLNQSAYSGAEVIPDSARELPEYSQLASANWPPRKRIDA